MEDQLAVFAVQLSQDIKAWEVKTGTSLLSVRQEFHVDSNEARIWKDIEEGRRVAGKDNVEVYAKIFWRTGILSADPRKIPARVITSPSGKKGENQLACSESQWKKWQEKYRKMKIPCNLPSTITLSAATEREAGGELDATMKSLVKQALREVLAEHGGGEEDLGVLAEKITAMLDEARGKGLEDVEQIARTYQKQLGQLTAVLLDLDLADIGALCEKLIDEIKKGSMTLKDRDKLDAQYSQFFKQLYPILGAYLQSRERREEALKLKGVFDDK